MLRMLYTGDIRSAILYAISSLLIVFFFLPVHEFAHAFTADKLGDKTPRLTGRLTLDPFKHLDPFGAVLIFLFGFGYARPVQINPRNFKNIKWGMALTALAGPISNIIMSFLLVLVYCIFYFIFPFDPNSVTVWSVILNIIAQSAVINTTLAVFNLIPIPPLDGSRLLEALLPSKWYFKLISYERYFTFIIFALILFGTFNGFISKVSTFLFNAEFYIAAWLVGLFL